MSATVRHITYVTCPECNGKGEVQTLIGRGQCTKLPCPFCGGLTWATAQDVEWRRIGAEFRDARIARDETISEFCSRAKLKRKDVSDAEQGRRNPDFLGRFQKVTP